MVTYVITFATLLKNAVLLLIFFREVNSDLYPRFKYSTDICQAIEEIYFKYPIQKTHHNVYLLDAYLLTIVLLLTLYFLPGI